MAAAVCSMRDALYSLCAGSRGTVGLVRFRGFEQELDEFELLGRGEVDNLAQDSLIEWACYRGSIHCYHFMFGFATIFIESGSNELPRPH
jgi:hypothetical protein